MNKKFSNSEIAMSTSWMPHLVFSSFWKPEEVDSNANEGMDIPARQEQGGDN